MSILVEINLNCGVTMRRWFNDVDFDAAQALKNRFNSDTFLDGTPKSDLALASAELYFDVSDRFKKN